MQQDTRKMVEIAMAIALSVVLSLLRLFRMPQGGSVTLAMLPLFIIAFRWGVKAGILGGVGAGLLQLVLGPAIVHPAQLILDYPLAYGLVGLAGVFRDRIQDKKNIKQFKWIFLGMIFGAGTRLISHVLSGVIFFAHYTPEGQNVWAYSIIYNASFLVPALLLCLVIIVPLKKVIFLDD